MRPALALVLLLAAAPASAQDTAASSKKDASQKDGKKRKVIRLDAITVEGNIQKPQAFYILQRSNLNFDELNKAESFTPQVVKSVEKEPF
ncbi:hypothetical protein [Archangium violaceum]|jgi:hypothetical protein|uniref:POTRA domain-containing protein n=1 Tax=Archangium violaceum Cb vi76 TaxID=1406225 RepID=A0A084SS91_9BACT|nr:hypothetical protein [Archangium violaceum]KFA91326.1 hypothetical protein Q664_22850 [Archangium violaceum Cb vi76]